MRKLDVAVVAICSTIALTGCGSSGEGSASWPSATQSPSPSSAISSPSPSVQAPNVLSPLDARDRDACSLIGPLALQSIKLSAESRSPFVSGFAEGCGWIGSNNDFGGEVLVNVSAGLSFAYLTKSSFTDFDEARIDGYPAVRIDAIGNPTCRFWVGIAESQSFSVGARALSTSAPDLCATALKMASAVIASLQDR